MAASKKRSGIWKYFTTNSVDESYVNCNTCSNNISRGCSNARSYGTTALVNHLRGKHPVLHVQYVKECAQAAFETASRRRLFLETKPNLKQPSYSGFVDLKKPSNSAISRYPESDPVGFVANSPDPVEKNVSGTPLFSCGISDRMALLYKA